MLETERLPIKRSHVNRKLEALIVQKNHSFLKAKANLLCQVHFVLAS
jgi:hypothetical protein